MNKNIYFNTKFITVDDLNSAGLQEYNPLKTYQDPDDKELKKIVQEFLEVQRSGSVRIVLSGSFSDFFARLKKQFSYIEAAGGFIKKGSEFLFIHRHGRWDLPKGKLEKGETVEVAAVRECEEECGVKDLHILDPLPSTFHIYPYKSGYALKQTYWFYMQTDYALPLVPQLEEAIDEVKWFTKKDIETVILTDTYFTISDTIKAALNVSHSEI